MLRTFLAFHYEDSPKKVDRLSSHLSTWLMIKLLIHAHHLNCYHWDRLSLCKYYLTSPSIIGSDFFLHKDYTPGMKNFSEFMLYQVLCQDFPRTSNSICNSKVWKPVRQGSIRVILQSILLLKEIFTYLQFTMYRYSRVREWSKTMHIQWSKQ